MTPPPTNRFDVEEWDRTYDESPPDARSRVFRRSGEVALAEVLRLDARGQKWLDAGCGTGRLTERLAPESGLVVGVDQDPEMIRFARRRTAGRRQNPVYLVAGAERLPFPDHSFDGVLAVSLLGCLDSPRDFFAEVRRVLRPEGVAVMTFTNRASWLLRLNYALPGQSRSSGPGNPAPDVFRLHHAGDIRKVLVALGYAVERLSYYNFVLDYGRWLFPPGRMADGLDRLGGVRAAGLMGRNFVVVARKQVL